MRARDTKCKRVGASLSIYLYPSFALSLFQFGSQANPLLLLLPDDVSRRRRLREFFNKTSIADLRLSRLLPLMPRKLHADRSITRSPTSEAAATDQAALIPNEIADDDDDGGT